MEVSESRDDCRIKSGLANGKEWVYKKGMFWNPEFGNRQPWVTGVVFRNPHAEIHIGQAVIDPGETTGSRRWDKWISLIAGGAAFMVVAEGGVLLSATQFGNNAFALFGVGASIVLACVAGEVTSDVVANLLRRPRS